MIGTMQHNGRPLRVRVLDLYRYHGRERALVQALPVNGREIRPFSSWTHGGWMDSSTATFPAFMIEGASDGDTTKNQAF